MTAAGAALFVQFQVGQPAVRGLHELLEPGLKIGGAGGLGRGGSGLSGVGSVKGTISPSEIRTALPVPGGTLGTRRWGCGLLDGQINPPCFIDADHLDLDCLPFRKEVADICHIGVGDLRDVDQTGPPARQTNAPNLVMLLMVPSRIAPTLISINGENPPRCNHAQAMSK